MQFHQLLDATIAYLQDLKAQGVRSVPVSQATMDALRQPPQTLWSAQVRAPKLETEPPHKPASSKSARPAASSEVSVPSRTKEERMTALRDRVLGCVLCPQLIAARKNVVFGVGNLDAELMFVGEAPGSDEDRQGEPFVGAAGQTLTKIILATGLRREAVYIANILKCRPDTPNQPYGNRKPTPEEMQTCIGYLKEQIDIIAPKVLVALGATAIEGLLGKTGITRLRGQWQTYQGIPLMPTYHPAFLLRSTQPLRDKRLVWEDMMQVMERLGLPISEKQRNFFLKA